LNFLRGKSLKQIDFRDSLNESDNKKFSNKNSKLNIKFNNNIKINFSSTADFSNKNYNTQNAFAKFFKKPLSFRIEEFEEINQLENNEINKENKAYAQQRFFANTVSESNLGFNAKDTNTLNDKNINYPHNKSQIKNLYLDDIEKVTLVNNQEELVKKYVLPEMKYLTTEERKKLIKYNVHDKTEEFVIINRPNIFLADLLNGDLNLNGKKNNANFSAENNKKSPEKFYDPRKTEIDVSDTKYGMYPKFLMSSSSFVRCVDSAYKNKNENQNEENKQIAFSKTLVPKKLGFKNAFNYNNFNLSNFNNTEENHFPEINTQQQIRNSSLSIKNIIHNENGYLYNSNNDPKTTKNLKNSFSGFNFNKKNLTNNQNNFSNLDHASPLNTVNALNNKNSTDAFLNFNNQIKNNFMKKSIKSISSTCYADSKRNEINPNQKGNSKPKKNNRAVVLDYPQIKIPIKPYKRNNGKVIKDKNYLTNGLMLDPEVIEEVRKLNQQVAKQFENEKEAYLTNKMSQNIDELNIIEGKINKLIQNSKEGMKQNKNYRRFNSNSSIIIIK
jgi:hypothetical protein